MLIFAPSIETCEVYEQLCSFGADGGRGVYWDYCLASLQLEMKRVCGCIWKHQRKLSLLHICFWQFCLVGRNCCHDYCERACQLHCSCSYGPTVIYTTLPLPHMQPVHLYSSSIAHCFLSRLCVCVHTLCCAHPPRDLTLQPGFRLRESDELMPAWCSRLVIFIWRRLLFWQWERCPLFKKKNHTSPDHLNFFSITKVTSQNTSALFWRTVVISLPYFPAYPWLRNRDQN